MSRLFAVLMAAWLLPACAHAPEPVGYPAPEAEVAELGTSDEALIERSRWVGIGSYDSCGLSWAIDLLQDGNRVSGQFLWETVRYELHGTIPPNGSLHRIRAGKSPDFNGTPAPRFVIISLDFGARRAVGSYAAETRGSNDCSTAVELVRYLAE